MSLSIAAFLIVVSMVMALVRATRGPSVYDRILALGSIGTLSTLLIAVVVFMMDQPGFLDIALLYVLINFIGPIAILRFFEYGEFGDDRGDEAGAPE